MQIHGPGESVSELPVHLNPGKGNPFAVITFGAAYVYVESADDAYKVIAAGIAALRLLDPDAPVQLAGGVTKGVAADDAQPGDTPEFEPRCDRCGATQRSAPLKNVDGQPGKFRCWEAHHCEERQAAKACAKCHAEPVKDGSPFGERCLDMCHEATEFDHCCMICATPEEARALGFPVVSGGARS